MNEVNGAAYDLSVFAPREERERQPLRVVKNPKKKKLLGKIDFAAVKIVAVAAVFLALVCSVLYAQAAATELASSIKVQEDQLKELKDDYTYLSNQIEMKTNISAVEEYATSKLGLTKMDKSQVYYVYGDQQNTITRSKTGLGKFTDTVTKGFLSMMEYFTS